MILYRSIGEQELATLISGGVVQGRYNCKREFQNSAEVENVCCFFVDELRWKDKEHHFLIVVDIPEEYLSFGIGEYWASKETKKTKVWTGRTGSELYKVREAYISSYSIKDVKEIYLFYRFTNWYVDQMRPICKENNVVLHWDDKKEPFDCTTPQFKKHSFYHQTVDDLDEWLESMKIDDEKFIEDIKRKVVKMDLSLEQARLIKQILRVC